MAVAGYLFRIGEVAAGLGLEKKVVDVVSFNAGQVVGGVTDVLELPPTLVARCEVPVHNVTLGLAEAIERPQAQEFLVVALVVVHGLALTGRRDVGQCGGERPAQERVA